MARVLRGGADRAGLCRLDFLFAVTRKTSDQRGSEVTKAGELKQGNDFDLRAFHDFLWTNGNVPIAWQRWEYLGLKDSVELLDTFPDANFR
jgi:hypothetical protein